MEGRLAKNGHLDGFISSCREILLNFLEQHFPVKVEFVIQPGIPPPVARVDEWSLQARSMLIQYAKQIELYDRWVLVVFELMDILHLLPCEILCSCLTEYIFFSLFLVC